MSLNNGNDQVSSKSQDEVDTPRKRMRLEISSRKGWSLTDRRADQEVLQEMGIGILEPDENELQCEVKPCLSPHKSLKRKHHDIENVNPNINSSKGSSPRSRHSPKGKGPSSPGPSKCKSPASSEKARVLQSTDPTILETTISEDYVIDEDTPLAQSVSVDYHVDTHLTVSTGGRTRSSSYNSPQKENLVINKHICPMEDGINSFSTLSDEMMLSIFKWLPKRTLAHCMLVCKRWNQVAVDESLWQRLDLGNKTISKGALGRILAKKPVVVRLASSEISEWHPTEPPRPTRVQYLDLSICSIDHLTLDNLLVRCPDLKKLSLENIQLYDSTCEIIGKCKNLETLNLTMAHGLTTYGITAILEGCQGLQSLNVSWCGLDLEALSSTVTSLPPRLQRLNIAGSKLLTDELISQLVDRCPRLLELDVSDCAALGADGVARVSELRRLEHLALSRCYCLPPLALTKLSSMPSLQFLEVWGMLQTSSLNLLKAALPAIQVNQFMFSAIARPTVGSRRTSIWGLRTRD